MSKYFTYLFVFDFVLNNHMPLKLNINYITGKWVWSSPGLEYDDNLNRSLSPAPILDVSHKTKKILTILTGHLNLKSLRIVLVALTKLIWATTIGYCVADKYWMKWLGWNTYMVNQFAKKYCPDTSKNW